MSATTGLPYVPLEAFPTSGVPATGGNSETDNLNIYYEVCWRPEFCVKAHAYAGAVRKYSLGHNVHGTGAAHDPGCWVSCLYRREPQ
jgi:hypothetical protein